LIIPINQQFFFINNKNRNLCSAPLLSQKKLIRKTQGIYASKTDAAYNFIKKLTVPEELAH